MYIWDQIFRRSKNLPDPVPIPALYSTPSSPNSTSGSLSSTLSGYCSRALAEERAERVAMRDWRMSLSFLRDRKWSSTSRLERWIGGAVAIYEG